MACEVRLRERREIGALRKPMLGWPGKMPVGMSDIWSRRDAGGTG
jgi:hypothetical protein